jgi:hypothetical protein
MRLAAALVGIASTGAAAAPSVGGCPVFPADNAWNVRVDALPVHERSDVWIAHLHRRGNGGRWALHMDFGAGLYKGRPIGIPWTSVKEGQPRVPVTFKYARESDPGPYPIPPDAPIEGVGPPNAVSDRHVIVVDTAACKLYELFDAWPLDGGKRWRAGSGAVFDLKSNNLRPEGWTSADAAGLPIFPGLVRYEEVAAGVIEHALRFSAPQTGAAHLWPARHNASANKSVDVPPLGARFRLKAGKDISRFSPPARVIAQAMKTYGMILADNGSPWFVSGAPHDKWDNQALRDLKTLKGSDFEVVDTSAMVASPDSGQVAPRFMSR